MPSIIIGQTTDVHEGSPFFVHSRKARKTIPIPEARKRVLRLMSSARRPITGGEIIAYILTSSTAAEVSALMAQLVDDGQVVASEVYHPNARGRRSRCYRLAASAEAEGGAT